MPYRDDQTAQEALRGRRDELRQELAEIQGRSAALDELRRAEGALERELAGVEQQLSRSAARRLRLLDEVRVASPCNESWEAMRGDDRVRFCEGCQQNVYNLSAMTRDEAEGFINTREGRTCVRLYRREDGTVLTSDCAVGARKKRVKRLVYGAVAGAGAAAATAWAMLQCHAPETIAASPQATAAPEPEPVELVQDPTPPPPAPAQSARPRMGMMRMDMGAFAP